VSDNVSAQQYLLRLKRLLRMVALNAPPRIVASECLLIAKAASEMGAVPTSMIETARKIAQMIEEARSTPEFRQAQEHAAKEEARMAEEVHLPGCPAYELWVKNSIPAAPGECNCGGSPQ
jgi:hypothetical protein